MNMAAAERPDILVVHETFVVNEVWLPCLSPDWKLSHEQASWIRDPDPPNLAALDSNLVVPGDVLGYLASERPLGYPLSRSMLRGIQVLHEPRFVL